MERRLVSLLVFLHIQPQFLQWRRHHRCIRLDILRQGYPALRIQLSTLRNQVPILNNRVYTLNNREAILHSQVYTLSNRAPILNKHMAFTRSNQGCIRMGLILHRKTWPNGYFAHNYGQLSQRILRSNPINSFLPICEEH
ncbi:unnamed protein product, partial [Nesidiocoris tenuis]